MRRTYIQQLRLRPGDSDYLAIVDALQEGILTDPTQVIQTATSLHRLADDLLAERGSVDGTALRKRLQGEGITLKDGVDYRSDFERLDTWSLTEIASHEAQKRSKLIVGQAEVTIIRPVVEAMSEAAQNGSVLVVGGAGSGKTGCLLALSNRLRASGFRVWYWAADSLPDHSPQEITAHLQLQHSWAALLAEAASGGGAILIIDGLDGLRDTRAQRAYLRLLALSIQAGIAVVASIRSFDLLHSVELQELFGSVPGSAPSPFSDSLFAHLNHIVVSELTETEVSQVISQLSTVETVLNNAPRLRPVVRNLFSLDLLCKLLAGGDSATQLSEISTQAELFERYWAKRIVSHPLHNEMEQGLRQITEKMVSEQNLQVIPEPLLGLVQDALFSAEILRHPPLIPGRVPRQELVEFNHHLLFDYAAELLFIRQRRSNLATELTQHDSWGLFLRPSLVLFFRYMWKHGRIDFWETSIELERRSVPLLHRMPGYLVVAEEARTREELQTTLERALQNNYDKANWMQLIRGIAAAATFSSLPKLFNRGSGDWWIEYARDLIHTGNSPLVYAGQRILFSAADHLEMLSTQGRRLMNDGAIRLISFHWRETVFPSDRVRPAIGWVCRTISADTVASSAIIREIISLEGLQRAGYIQ
ncbi:MAG: ATP-binding protein, partial [Blastocatellia bacterium]